ncbi:branched-chain amino acid ABC transporter permease [Blastococcus goldschmidtiae]|uniref:Branched-chain amino acid ABC transporter permease n=1 Tax=Blastococcus goldschmidtiae TaxID=3075546 RepID=A0ABU2K9S4_9ACTN|nr:branched-chain amino acid ABC transporter permease [Blastococcus sp. DSM 46792]MDT0276944.1 branched-chain amino acid ABC transporter permease [Blastococcus sp. DSM 46792]
MTQGKASPETSPGVARSRAWGPRLGWDRGALARRVTRLPRSVKWALIGVLVVLLYALPLLELPIISTPDTDFGAVLFTVASYVLVALGLNIVLGYAGLLDLGYVGFYAVGAYTVAVLGSLQAQLSWWLLIPLAVIITTISGILLGAPTLRVRGDYLAIVTLGFGEIIRLTALNTEWLGAAKGITGVPRPPSVDLFELPHLEWEGATALIDLDDTTTFLSFGVADQAPYYWLALTVIFVVLGADRMMRLSRIGRAWEATREDEDAAELMGVPTFRFKLLAFATGAFIGGLSGALFASRQGFINPESFLLLLSILFLAAVVVGGAGNRYGVILGAIVVAYLPERFRGFEEWRLLVFGLALLLLANFRPQGLLPPRRARRAQAVDEQIDSMEEGKVRA